MLPVASSPAPVRFRPMPLPELLDELFRLYRNHFSLLIGVSLIVSLPGLVWTLLTGTYRLSLGSYSNLFPTTPGAAPNLTSDQLGQLLQLVGLGVLGAIVLSPFLVGAVYRAVADVATGRPASVGSVLRETLQRYFPLLGLVALIAVMALVWVILTGIGFVLLILPGLGMICVGVFFAVRWSLTVAAMMAENIGPIRGLGRSWNLISGMWWRSFGILLVVGIMQAIISYAFYIVVLLLSAAISSGTVQLAVISVATTLLGALINPITPIGITLLYFDLRVRKEGLDLDQLAQQTSPGPAPA